MKAIVCVCLFGLVAVALARPDGYTTKFDDTNIDEIMGSPRLVDAYCKCLLDKGPCTVEGKELRSHIGDALETDCVKCNDKQKAAAKKVIHFLYHNKPECWKDLSDKYDPEGKYTKKHQAELDEIKSS